MLKETSESILMRQDLHLFRGVLSRFVIYKEESRSPRVYSTAKHSEAADEDGHHGSLTELTWEGLPGVPKDSSHGRRQFRGPRRDAQGKYLRLWRIRYVSCN